MQLVRIAAGLLLALTLVIALPAAPRAQGLFSPAITVNDRVITGYELDQREKMLRVLRAPGDPRKLAREQLIDDRLRLEAAEAAGIRPSAEEVLDGMSEFAGRANLTREEFVQALGGAGVSEETFRDFVQAGLAWRLFVQQRFAGRTNLSEAEIDRALSNRGGSGSIRVLISELIMPAPPPQAEAVLARAARISQLRSEAAFSAEARQYSATASRGAGGRLPWQNLSDLPPALQPIILGLAPGEVTEPLQIPNAVALFQLRAIEEADYTAPEVAAVEYAAYYLAGGRSKETLAQARAIAARADTCDDLYGIAKGQPAEVLDRRSVAPGELPTDIAFELSKLDPGEVSTALTRNNGNSLMVLMLCGRTNAVNTEVNREEIALGLRNQRISALADSYLSQLRADARIVEK